MADHAATRSLSAQDVLDVCQVLLQRCGLSAGQLAAHMGEPLQPAPPAITPRMAQALRFAERPDGVTISELEQLMNIGMPTAHTYLTGLTKRGQVSRVKQFGVRGFRYFADGEAALAWVTRGAERLREAAAAAPIAPKPSAEAPQRNIKRAPPAETSVTFHPSFAGVARAPTPIDRRFAVAPGELLTGGFSSSKPGIDPLTGKSWGAA